MRKIVLIIRLTNNIWWNFQSYYSMIFIPDFSLLNWELDNFTFKVLYWVILYLYYIYAKQDYNTFTVVWEKSKIVSFASSITKGINLLSLPPTFPVKLIYCVAFGSALSAYCSLKSIDTSL